MRMFKRVLVTLLVVAMMASMAIVVSAEETTLIEKDVENSITIADATAASSGKGLAFRITMNIQGAQVNSRNEFVNENAIATVDGVEYKVVKMGAVMANQAENIAQMNNLTLADVTGQYVLDIPAKYLCAVPEANYCEFAVRITNLPDKALGRAIACRPYIVLEKDGVQSTIYGEGDISTFNSLYYENVPEEKPALSADLPELDGKIKITATSAEYVAYETTNYKEAFKVTATLANVSTNALSSDGDYVTYVCKDSDGNELSTVKVTVGVMNPEETKDVEFYAPIGTATIEVSELNVNVPDITLPAIGSDIDVTKKKNRIRVSAAEASFNEDGTIHVKWTFKNYTSNWITEETDYIKYACYDQEEEMIQKATTLYIGVIDTKKNPVKTFEFDVPADTAEVAITSSKIVYWTEWA